jgi:hypothetical protein
MNDHLQQQRKIHLIALNFQMRYDLHRHLFIDPASDSFPQMDVFSRDQVLTLLTELGHKERNSNIRAYLPVYQSIYAYLPQIKRLYMSVHLS